jgi:hypothetical protein
MVINKLPTSASLKEVIDKFEEISLQDFSSINITVAEQLPDTVKDGKIVIIEEEKINKIMCDTKPYKDVTLNNNEVYIELNNHEDNLALKCEIVNNIHLFNYYISAIYKKIDDTITQCKDVYMGIDGAWVKVLDSKVDIFANGKFKDGLSLTKGYVDSGATCTTKITSESDTYPNCIYIKQTTPTEKYSASCVMNNSIDVTNYNKLTFVLERLKFVTVQGTVNLYLGLHTESKGYLTSLKAKYSRSVATAVTSTLLCEIDISKLTGEHYIQLGIYGSGKAQGIEYYVSNIYFVK